MRLSRGVILGAVLVLVAALVSYTTNVMASVGNKDGLIIEKGLIIDGLDRRVAETYIERAKTDEQFRTHSPEGAPVAWVVFSDPASSTDVAAAYWSTEEHDGHQVTTASVAVMFDQASGKIVGGLVRRQTLQEDGRWLQEMIMFDGRVISRQVSDTPEIVAPNAISGDPEVQHSYSQCLKEELASCQSTYSDCVDGCDNVCDGSSPVSCELCRASCVAERIGCRMASYSWCAAHLIWE